jgi:MarR family transcriptional regulator, lower aerobic nicotinate degradation pathway regulator
VPIQGDNRVGYSFLGNMTRKFHPISPRRRPALSRLDAHIGFWLRCVSNQFSHALNRELEDKGVTLAEWIVLRELYEGDLRPSALAERLGLTRGAVSKLARKLTGSLMITQRASGEDGRAQILSLTDDGRVVVCVLAVILDKTDEEFFGHLDAETRALIVANMREIVRRRGLRAVPADW